jgi:hypothetical protein
MLNSSPFMGCSFLLHIQYLHSGKYLLFHLWNEQQLSWLPQSRYHDGMKSGLRLLLRLSHVHAPSAPAKCAEMLTAGFTEPVTFFSVAEGALSHCKL